MMGCDIFQSLDCEPLMHILLMFNFEKPYLSICDLQSLAIGQKSNVAGLDNWPAILKPGDDGWWYCIWFTLQHGCTPSADTDWVWGIPWPIFNSWWNYKKNKALKIAECDISCTAPQKSLDGDNLHTSFQYGICNMETAMSCIFLLRSMLEDTQVEVVIDNVM